MTPATKASNWLVPLGLAITTGILSFTVALPIVQRLRSTKPSQPVNSAAVIESAETGATVSMTAPTSSKATASAATATQEADEAPPGIVIPPDKGLVVVRTGGVHSIFVDDEFIGRGPERVVSLNPGQHKVRASLNGEERTEAVDVVVGRVTKLSLNQSEE